MGTEGKANERKGKVKRGKDEEVNGQGGKRVPRPHTGLHTMRAGVERESGGGSSRCDITLRRWM